MAGPQADCGLGALRVRLSLDLPVRAESVASEYAAFAESGTDGAQAKDFAARHAACKAALAHLDALVKLARWAEAGAEPGAELGASEGGADEAARLVAAAREALAASGMEPKEVQGGDGNEDGDEDGDQAP